MLKNSPIHLLIERFVYAFEGLDIDISDIAIEQLSLSLYAALENPKRDFHNTLHVLDISKGLSPISTLAALYHDFVYWQVDGALPALDFFETWVSIDTDKRFHFYKAAHSQSPFFEHYDAIFAIFDMLEVTPFGKGTNEFLSAAIAVHYLAPYLEKVDLYSIMSSIEATIPFRLPAPVSSYELLESRLLNLGLSLAQVEVCVHRAVELANRDVANFASPDVGLFLDNTWKLLPEMHDFIIKSGSYLVSEYEGAVSQMYNFLNFVQPEMIFHNYKNNPPTDELQALRNQAAANLAIAKDYLEAKRITMLLLRAIAEESGGDAPISFFLGDVRYYNLGVIPRAEDYLPPITKPMQTDHKVLHFLDKGRIKDTHFDLKNSPLAAFVYKFLGQEGVRAQRKNIELFSSKNITSFVFLSHFPPLLLRHLIYAISKIAVVRHKRLMELWKALQQATLKK
ncbi:MAG: hypothetical protein JJT94_04300 [Bernardetiaceae bacterium]|nr:hypothetical protein [Bernardetiaceae bacterium]